MVDKNNKNLKLVKGSVVYSTADVIVNAANNNLTHGGGVCGAIFEAAGVDKLNNALKKYGFCKTGDAVITEGFDLKAKYIIHAVGPVYTGSSIDKFMLASCYRRSLEIADENMCDSIAFCCISTGIYGYPLEEAAKIAINEVIKYKSKHIKTIYFYCYNDREYEVYSHYIKE